jgi:hypothetical protein
MAPEGPRGGAGCHAPIFSDPYSAADFMGTRFCCRDRGLASLGWMRAGLLSILESIPSEILRCQGR